MCAVFYMLILLIYFQVYTINIARKWLGRSVTFADPTLAMKYECPVTLGPFYKPVSIKGSDPKHVFTEPLIDEMTRTSKLDPLDGTPLENDWKNCESGLDAEMSAAVVHCLYQYAGNVQGISSRVLKEITRASFYSLP